MGNKIFTSVVVAMWAASMSWLLVAKILPPFLRGDPPRAAQPDPAQIVCWRIYLSDRPIGWAVSTAFPSSYAGTEVHSTVVMEDLPLRELAPAWMRSVVDRLGELNVHMRNRIQLDAFSNLSSFYTSVGLNQDTAVVRLFGDVLDNRLRVRIRAGGITHEENYPVPGDSVLLSDLTPDAKMLNLDVGRTWQKEAYSPFRPPTSLVELVQAEVVSFESIMHHNELTPAYCVEYRSLSSPGVAADGTLRATLWVAEDGTVLRQDTNLMSLPLRFERMTDEASLKRGEEILDLDAMTARRRAAATDFEADPSVAQ